MLPRAVAYDDARRTLLLEAVEGSRVADLDAEELPRGYHQLGASLASLHSMHVHEGLPAFERLTPARVQQVARVIVAARPDVRRDASELAAELGRRYETNGGPRVCLHGDVHPKNFIARGGSLTLIDLDQCGAGDAAADLGSLLASLIYGDITSGASQSSAKSLGEAFLSGYASARALPSVGSLRWHTAAALLAERALRAVNRVRPEGLSRLRELLAAASDVLREVAA